MEERLQKRLEEITKLADFKLSLVNVYHPNNYGDYFLEDSTLKIYVLDREGNVFPPYVIEREALHELAHHLQIKHTSKYKFTQRTAHGYVFQQLFARLLKKYYNNRVPQDTKDYLVEGGILSEKASRNL